MKLHNGQINILDSYIELREELADSNSDQRMKKTTLKDHFDISLLNSMFYI